MELKFLDVFCKVYETGSFSKAAKKLYLTQPTISSHIKSLEESISLSLFDRMGKEIIPTRAGEMLYTYARRIEQLKKDAGEALSAFSGRTKGHIEIGGSTIPGEYLLPVIIGKFRKQFPDISVSLHIGDTGEIVNMLLEGKIEVGMVGAKSGEKHLEFTEFSEDELILVASNDFKTSEIEMADVSKIPLIGRERGSGSWASMKKCLSINGIESENLNIVAEMGSTEAVKTAVKSGCGLSFVSTLAVRDELSSGSLKQVKVEGLCLKRTIYLAGSRMRSKSPLCQAFTDFIGGSMHSA